MAGRTDDPSDATFQDHLAIAKRFEPLEVPHVTVDNSGDWERTRERIEDILSR